MSESEMGNVPLGTTDDSGGLWDRFTSPTSRIYLLSATVAAAALWVLVEPVASIAWLSLLTGIAGCLLAIWALSAYLAKARTPGMCSYLRTFVELSPVPMAVYDLDRLNVVYANDDLCALLRCRKDEIEGQLSLNWAAEWVRPRIAEGLQRLMRYGRSEARALPLQSQQGDLVWVDIRTRLVPGPKRCALAAVHDITERKVMEEELVKRTGELRLANRELSRHLAQLAQSESRHRALFTQAMDAIVLVDPQTHTIRDANPRALQVLGVHGEGLVGRPISQLETEASPGLTQVVASIAESKGVQLPEVPFRRGDGQTVYLDVSGGLVTFGEESLVQLVLHDVTDRRALREALEQTNRELQHQREALERANEELAKVSRVKTQFLANMSHEIRTPLNAINGFAELLADETYGHLDDQQRAFVERIIEAGQHLLQLINDVIDLAKVEAGAIELDRQPVAINRLAEQTVRVVKGTARKKNIAIRVTPAKGEPVVLADERRIKQVLFNLLANAVRYSPEGSVVDVSVEKTGDNALVKVVDRGIGIAPEDQERIFEEFVRVGPVEQHPSGAGLGLPLSRNFVRLHGGEMGVQSELGKGSTFWFTLPLAQPPQAEAQVLETIAGVPTEEYRPLN